MRRAWTGSDGRPTSSPSWSPRSSARVTGPHPAAPRWSRRSRGRGPSTAASTSKRWWSESPTMSSEVAAPPRQAAESQWTKCPSCDAFVYHKRLRRNLGVCPECNFHFRLPVRERLEQLLDEGSFVDRSSELEPLDVLSFADSKPYGDRLAEAQRKTGG